MSQAVNIVIGVIEQMNLSGEDRLKLVEMLSKDVAAKPQKPKRMTEMEIYRREFEKWLVDKKKLYPPKK